MSQYQVISQTPFDPSSLSAPLFNAPVAASLIRDITESKGAAKFLATESRKLTLADEAAVRFGATTSWTLRFVIFFDPADMGVDTRYVCKGPAGTDILVRKDTTNRIVLSFGVSPIVSLTNTQVLKANTVYVVTVKFDSANPTTGLICTVRSSFGTTTTTANTTTVTGFTPGTTTFTVGGTAAGAQYGSGWVAHLAKWNRLTTSEEDETMFNRGRGFGPAEAAAVVGLTTGLSWWFAFDTSDGGSFLTDRIGGVMTFTQSVNPVTEVTGNRSTAATADGDVVKYIGNEGTSTTTYTSQMDRTARFILRFENGVPVLETPAGGGYMQDGIDQLLAFTDDMWACGAFKTTQIADGMGLLGRWNNAVEGWALYVVGTALVVRIRGNNSVTWNGGATAINDGAWHVLHVVRKNRFTYLYCDGELKAAQVQVTMNATTNIIANWGARGNDTAVYYQGRTAFRLYRATAPTDLERIRMDRYIAGKLSVPSMKFGNIPTLSYAGGGTIPLVTPTSVKTAGASGAVYVMDGNQYRMRKALNGNVHQIEFTTNTPTTGNWRFLLLRQDDFTKANYTCIQMSEAFVVGGPGRVLYNLLNPLRYQQGDYIGIYAPNAADVGCYASSGQTIYSYAGLPSVGQTVAFTSLGTGNALAHFAYGEGPPIVVVGDSNSIGRGPGLLGGAYWCHTEASGSTPQDRTANFAYLNYLADNRLQFAIYGAGGQTLDWGISTGVPNALAANPYARMFVLSLGSNDIALNNSNSAAMIPKFTTIRNLVVSALGSGVIFYVMGLWPFTTNNNTQADNHRQADADLAALVATWQNSYYFNTRNIIGQARPTNNNNLDDLITEYDRGDGVHPKYAGMNAISAVQQPEWSDLLFV